MTPVGPGLLQALQFPAKTELKEAHHGHGSAAGLEALAGSQHTLLPHPSSVLGMDYFSVGLNGKEMQACRQEAALVQPVVSETQAMSQRLPRLEVAEVLF